jgi:hypothetical protein
MKSIEDRSFIDEVEPTATYFSSGDQPLLPLALLGCGVQQELQGSERKRKKCYKI